MSKTFDDADKTTKNKDTEHPWTIEVRRSVGSVPLATEADRVQGVVMGELGDHGVPLNPFWVHRPGQKKKSNLGSSL